MHIFLIQNSFLYAFRRNKNRRIHLSLGAVRFLDRQAGNPD